MLRIGRFSRQGLACHPSPPLRPARSLPVRSQSFGRVECLAKNLSTLLDLCVSSLCRGHANLLCIVPILTDNPRRKSPLTPGKMRKEGTIALHLMKDNDDEGFAFFSSWASCRKNCLHFSICACHPCAGAMLILSVSFQFYRMIPEGHPANRASAMHTLSRISET